MAKKHHTGTKKLYKKLDKLYEQSPEVNLSDHKGWIIFSDLHMGDGGSTDDFRRNAKLFTSAHRAMIFFN
jgi:hypothetical protein